MLAMPSYKSAVENREAFQRESNDELQVMVADFQEAYGVYQEGEIISDVRKQLIEERLSKKKNDISLREQAIQNEVQLYSQELNQPIIDKVEKAVKTVFDRNGYDYVFEITTLMIHKVQTLQKM
jgi:Skp family chaperone for outer membrane proteins